MFMEIFLKIKIYHKNRSAFFSKINDAHFSFAYDTCYDDGVILEQVFLLNPII